MSENKKPATFVAIGKVRFSYAHVFKPHAVEEGDDPKYGVSLIIPKSNTALIAKCEAAIEAARQEGIRKFGDKWAKKLKMPIRDGDEDRDDEAYKNSKFINANSSRKPGVVDAAMNPIIDEDEFYSGCYGFASVNFYPFSGKSNGVAAGLSNIMKKSDGERLGNASTPETDFAGIDDDDLM